jgi:hypothetical protein
VSVSVRIVNREPIGREEAIRRAIAWERANPPPVIDRPRFDYEAEDEAAARAARTTRSA